jgi:hypothetical protein
MAAPAVQLGISQLLRPSRRLTDMRSAIAIVWLVALTPAPVGAQAPLFDFHSAFWINLHHYLHALGRPGGLTETLPADATASERQAWTDAVTTYRTRYGMRSLVFDEELVRVKLVLAAAESREPLEPAGLPDAMYAALVSAAPVYRRHAWPAHDAANRRTIADAGQLVGRHGRTIATRLAATFGATWPSTPLRVDFVPDAGPPGNAYTTNDPTHITIAAADPRHGGLHLLEVLFHEASHGWDATLIREVDAAATQQGVRVRRDLWHALLFYNAGVITSDVLAAAGIGGYEMYADKEGMFTGAWPYRPAIARHWSAFLAGTISRPDAIARIVTDVATPGK